MSCIKPYFIHHSIETINYIKETKQLFMFFLLIYTPSLIPGEFIFASQK